MWKNIVQSGRPQMTIYYGACTCMLDTESYKHTLRLSDTYCFSTAAMVTRTRLYVMLYAHWRSCLLIKLQWTQACTFCVLTTHTLSSLRRTPKFLTINQHEYPLQGCIITTKSVDESTHTHTHTDTNTHAHTHMHACTHTRTQTVLFEVWSAHSVSVNDILLHRELSLSCDCH